ncbi:MAG: CvpA family protein [Bacteroidetes bacterium]|nr:CvpA family protein [Bacteroidota bacterium]
MSIDAFFLIILIVALFRGIKNGFVVGLFSLFSFIIGLAAAMKLSAVVAHSLENTSGSFSKWLPFFSFIIVFIVVVLLVSLGAKIIKKVLSFSMLGWLDRLLGIALYLILYTIIFSVFLFFAGKIHLVSAQTIANSHVYPYIQDWGPVIINNLGKIIPAFKDLFVQLQDFFSKFETKIALL